MDRDPNNYDCTKNPIFLLQVGSWQWSELPHGVSTDGESLWVEDISLVDDWLKKFVTDGYIETSDEFWSEAEKATNECENELARLVWHTETVFLTREEAERFANCRSYRWPKWRVYCVPCEGELADILNNYQRPSTVPEA